MKLRLPFGGADDRDAYTDQRLGYSSDLLNIVPWDSITGRWRLSQRPGWTKFCSTVIGGSKTRDIQVVSSANERLTYTSNGSSVTTEQNAATPAVSDSKNVRTDRQGNTYWLNGRTGIVKRNSAGIVIWTVNIPTSDTGHEARALFVDVDDRVYAAISTGGLQSTAKMVSWRQTNDNKTELVWDVTLGVYVESIKVKNGKLVTVQNNPERGKAFVVVYENYTVADPTETSRWKTAYPANDMDPGIDGSVFVAAEPLSNRGFDPAAPDAAPTAEDWTPELLTNFKQRAWCWVRNDSDDDFEVTPVSAVADSLDGGVVETWYDRTGNGRHLYAGSTTGTAGPRFRSLGSNGARSVYFNGTTSKLVSATNAGVTDPFEQLTTVPGYTGSMFSLTACFKATNKSALQWLFGILPTSGFTNGIQAFLNREASSTLAGTNTEAAFSWFENPASGGQGLNSYPNHYPITSLHPWVQTTTGSARNLKNDWLIVTLIHGNGVGTFKSYLRINGNPVDEWTSTAKTWTDAFQIGNFTGPSTSTTDNPGSNCSKYQGEMFEMLVLREYTPAGGSLSLISQPSYPESNWAANSNTEVEKIESYMAARHGCLHVLPIGTTARLLVNSQPANNDTVTVGGQTYTFKTTLSVAPAVAFEVLRGGSAAAAALNLIKAINLSGTAATDYGTGTTVNTSAWAFPFSIPETGGAVQVVLRSVSRTTTTFVTTETLTDALSIWTNGTSVDNLAATGASGSRENDGFFPHPYGIQKTTRATGGPPRKSDADYALPSKAALLNSVYGLLVKYSDGGRARWVATSDFDGSSTSIGGVGYGCVVSSVGDVYSMGPRQAATGSIAADDVDIRKFVDQGDAFQTTTGTTALTNWIDDPGAATYNYPRMAVDKYDNVWCPISTAGTTSLIGYAKIGVALSGNDNANELAVVTNITDNPNGYAVAVDPTYPDYPSSFTNTRPRNVYLATEKTGSNNYALYKLGLVAVASATSGGAVTRTYLAVNAGTIYTFTSGGTVTAVGSSVLDSASMFITSAVFDGRVFYSDGGQKGPVYYDTRTGTVQSWTPTDGGEILPGIKFMVAHGERLFIASPTRWGCSEINDAFKWNVYPEIPTYASAADGPSSTAGRPHDPIQTIIPTNTDRLIFGCANSIRMIVGNPAVPSTQIVVITASLGMAFGPCWALDGEGTIYFMASDCGVYAMPETGGQPVPLSHPSAVNEQQASILRRLQGINLATYYAKLLWDKRNQCLHVFVCPYGAGGTIVSHYLWHKPSNAWFPVQFGATGKQPCSAYMFDADTDSGRRLAIGCEDGYVRYWDDAAKTDDGSPIEVRALIGPIVPDSEEYEAVAQSMDVLLASNQDGCEFDFYASDVADVRGTPQVSGNLTAGRNCVSAGPSAGAHLWVLLRNRSVVSGSNAGSRFSIESVHLELAQGAPKGVA